MPARLPALPGLELAARYAPAEGRGIGGDWYDAFTVPDGRLWLITGDVAGHGLRAAVVMGRVKSALRAYALAGGATADVVSATNRKVMHFEMNTLVTVVCATAEPPYDEFEICSAGHPPPVLAALDDEAELVALTPGPPLGVTTPRGLTTTRVTVPRGGVLVLYTDGLIERRGEIVDEGLDRLCAATVAGPPDLVCHRIMRRLVGNTPGRRRHRDPGAAPHLRNAPPRGDRTRPRGVRGGIPAVYRLAGAAATAPEPLHPAVPRSTRT